ncbi:MAG: GWxTD domain-containing protein [Acidobacteriota bacterium]
MKRVGLFLLFVLLSLPFLFSQRAKKQKHEKARQSAQQEEGVDYFRKWLTQDVVYIISDEEKEVFKKLTTVEEKENFVEQFWFRRDPDPRTAANEAKEEHYRRVAYVNEKFGSGVPGWKTDRGRIYITFGPPDIIEDHPSGGWYYRPANEGGGATSTYPFQIWTYNYIEGVGDQIEIQFADPSWAGEYRMALEPSEKDALLHVGFMGPTDAELEGRLSKLDRPYFSPGNYRNTKMQNKLGIRMKDKPFEKMIRFYKLQQPEPIKYKDLKQLVKTQVIYRQMPFQMSYNYFTVDAGQVLVPVTLEFHNKDLTFSPVPGKDTQRGQLNIYGVVQSLSGRIITEFEDTLVLDFPPAELNVRRRRKSVYQQMLLLAPGRFKLTLAIKDDNSDQVGTLETGLILPEPAGGMSTSSIILASTLRFLRQVPDQAPPFVLGSFKVIPNVTRTFNSRDNLGLYLQIYNSSLDQASLEPMVEVEYQIMKGGRVVKSYLDPKKNSIINYGDRLVVVEAFDLKDLRPGEYTLRVKVSDQIQKKELSREVKFSITSS